MGVLFGQVLSEEAYAPIMAHTASRGAFMRILHLTFPRRIAPFDEWILPLFIFPARAYFQHAGRCSVFQQRGGAHEAWTGLT